MSEATDHIRIKSEMFTARAAVDHLTLETARRYRIAPSDPLGAATPNAPWIPEIWSDTLQFPPLRLAHA